MYFLAACSSFGGAVWLASAMSRETLAGGAAMLRMNTSASDDAALDAEIQACMSSKFMKT